MIKERTINNKKLSVVIGTYNRLHLLKKCINSILMNECVSRVYVTDAGSTDGTLSYLEKIASEKIKPIFVGKKLGQAKAYNDVFYITETEYVCWLSDDNIVVNNGLDLAVKVLNSDKSIGMVGLKTKDVEGPFVYAPYIGGISSLGILNVNQGVLPTRLMKKLGGFSEEFRDYGIDPDLTAKVLFSGHKVVYTKKIALLHYRGWSTDKSSSEYQVLRQKQKRGLELYQKKYYQYNKPLSCSKIFFGDLLKKLLLNKQVIDIFKKRKIIRDLTNVLQGKYISLFDFFINLNKEYYLVQKFK